MKRTFLLLILLVSVFYAGAQTAALKYACTYLKNFYRYNYISAAGFETGACKNVTIEEGIIKRETDIIWKNSTGAVTAEKNEFVTFDSRDISANILLDSVIEFGGPVAWIVILKAKNDAMLIHYTGTLKSGSVTHGREQVFFNRFSFKFGSRDVAIRFRKLAQQVFE